LFSLFATGVCKFAARIVDTGGKIAAGINNTSVTSGKIYPRVVDTGGASLDFQISQGYGMIYEKKPGSKIL
jgi:hypothetical protein